LIRTLPSTVVKRATASGPDGGGGFTKKKK
jgi:hypothetical protein